jgi:drug/metabolite transporter (DMT)-like permease
MSQNVADPGLFTPRVFFPFMIVSLIWGGTWLVIRDQLGTVPPSWSVTYRFSIAAIGMFLLGTIMRLPMRLDARGLRWAALLGVAQFTFNFNFVYLAEHHITSGLVAVIFALLIIPNALLARWWLGRPVSKAFILGSVIATTGVLLLMLQEYRTAPVGANAVLIGGGLALSAVMCASVSNVMQGLPAISRFPTIAILAWAMLLGALANGLWSLATAGLPVFDFRASYIGGLLFLGIIGSVVTFPLYFNLIRDIGPGKAAYTSVLIPVIAMLLSTIFEGYRWSMLAGGGAVLVMAGLLVAMQSSKPAR